MTAIAKKEEQILCCGHAHMSSGTYHALTATRKRSGSGVVTMHDTATHAICGVRCMIVHPYAKASEVFRLKGIVLCPACNANIPDELMRIRQE